MDITYTIEFFSYWHCGSGLSAGADVDSLVIKDAKGMPFVPGKTIKGLIREAAETLTCLAPDKYPSQKIIDKSFCPWYDTNRQGKLRRIWASGGIGRLARFRF